MSEISPMVTDPNIFTRNEFLIINYNLCSTKFYMFKTCYYFILFTHHRERHNCINIKRNAKILIFIP